MTAISKGSSVKGSIMPQTFQDQVSRDQMITEMKSELHKVSTKKPDIAKHQSRGS